jgi:hypothetical protein
MSSRNALAANVALVKRQLQSGISRTIIEASLMQRGLDAQEAAELMEYVLQLGEGASERRHSVASRPPADQANPVKWPI